MQPSQAEPAGASTLVCSPLVLNVGGLAATTESPHDCIPLADKAKAVTGNVFEPSSSSTSTLANHDSPPHVLAAPVRLWVALLRPVLAHLHLLPLHACQLLSWSLALSSPPLHLFLLVMTALKLDFLPIVRVTEVLLLETSTCNTPVPATLWPVRASYLMHMASACLQVCRAIWSRLVVAL